ncbi:unnamed protein product [Closterium sp. Naga37s-1]|nr:unnamed protein product [Closterium sp. Naga37s-1]
MRQSVVQAGFRNRAWAEYSLLLRSPVRPTHLPSHPSPLLPLSPPFPPFPSPALLSLRFTHNGPCYPAPPHRSEYLSMGDVLDVGAISPALVRTMDLRWLLCRLKSWPLRAPFASLPPPQEYLSMGDVLDVGAISPALVRTMDLRHFVARHCRCNVSVACPGDACDMLFQGIAFSNQSLTQCLQACGARIGASTPTPARLWGTLTGLLQGQVLLPSDPALSVAEWERKGVLYAVPHMCNETIWTVGNYSSKDELLQTLGGGHVRYDHVVCRNFRRDPHRFPLPLSVHFLQQPPLSAAQVMAFGSMFDVMITDLNLQRCTPCLPLAVSTPNRSPPSMSTHPLPCTALYSTH